MVSGAEPPAPPEAAAAPGPPQRTAPDPSGARTRQELLSFLRQLVAWARVSVRELAARASAAGHRLTKSTAGRILAAEGATFPGFEPFEAILAGVGLPDAQVQLWTRAWNRCRREVPVGENRTHSPSDLSVRPRRVAGAPGAAPMFELTLPSPSVLLEAISLWSSYPVANGASGEFVEDGLSNAGPELGARIACWPDRGRELRLYLTPPHHGHPARMDVQVKRTARQPPPAWAGARAAEPEAA